MPNMSFAVDVEVILDGAVSANSQKMQCPLFSVTTGRRYQQDLLSIDITGEQVGARTAKKVRHTAIQVPFGRDVKREILDYGRTLLFDEEGCSISNLPEQIRTARDAARDEKRQRLRDG